MREGELHGRDYFFVEKEQFEELTEKGEFLEYAEVHGNFYGTSINQIKTETEMGHDIILEIDTQGAESVKNKLPEAVGVFILPPSFEVLKQRLISRETESREDLNLRLKNSKTEVSHFTDFDYVIINDDKAVATDQLKAVIIAERLKQVRQTAKIEAIINTFDFTDK
jgi:guanylate kinase